MRRRLDAELLRRGLFADIAEAQSAIDSRTVMVDGAPALKATTLVNEASSIRIESSPKFVSRGGDKLDGALDDLGVDVAGRRCLDAGAGSGGFTDVLLHRGAAHVVAVDVGFGQFDWTLRNDPRVELLEKTHLRDLTTKELPAFDVIAADLSFISLTTAMPFLTCLGSEHCDYVLMVKPQFEARDDQIEPGGIVKEPVVWSEAISRVLAVAEQRGLTCVGIVVSRIKGAKGNVEFFVHLRPVGDGEVRDAQEMVRHAVRSAS